MHKRIGALMALGAVMGTIAGTGTAHAASFLVEVQSVRDDKAVVATVESANIVAARVRTGGTIVSLTVHEGDVVKQGQVIAIVADRKLGQQFGSLDAQISGLHAQAAQAQAELDRNRPLFENGVISQTAMESFKTALSVAQAGLKAKEQERAALGEQITQGDVLAPASGRVTAVPASVGAVMMPGEAVATLARAETVLKLRVPERNAHTLSVGDSIRIDGEGLPQRASITLIYPRIENGMVTADVALPPQTSYFVGQRVQAWIPMESRPAIVVPVVCLTERYGIDFVKLEGPDGQSPEVPIQRGRAMTLPDGSAGVEILSGLKAGDALVLP